jgi:hypothetical protein
MDPRTVNQDIEQNRSLTMGEEDRFAGYAVIGLPSACGLVLSLRFPGVFSGAGIYIALAS